MTEPYSRLMKGGAFRLEHIDADKYALCVSIKNRRFRYELKLTGGHPERFRDLLERLALKVDVGNITVSWARRVLMVSGRKVRTFETEKLATNMLAETCWDWVVLLEALPSAPKTCILSIISKEHVKSYCLYFTKVRPETFRAGLEKACAKVRLSGADPSGIADALGLSTSRPGTITKRELKSLAEFLKG